jgi:hypothetical protein
MKILAAALVVGALTVPVGGAQQRLPDLVRDGLRGPVRSVSVEFAPLVNRRGRSVEGARLPVSGAVYDAGGDQIDETRYVDGRLIERTAFRYAGDGVQFAESSIRTSDAVMGLVSLSSDAGGRDAAGNWRVDRQVLRSGYDVRGLRVETSIFEKLGREEVGVSREQFRYDADGRLVESRSASVDGITREITKYTYAPNGDVVECDILRGDGALERRVVYSGYRRDARGNWVRRTEVETFASGRIADERVCYRTIAYYDDSPKAQLAARDPREAAPVARAHGTCPYAAGDALAAKLQSRESDSMDHDGLFLAVALTSRYNVKKTDTPTTLAAERDGKATRPRRAARVRRPGAVDALVDADSSETVVNAEPAEEPALGPAR